MSFLALRSMLEPQSQYLHQSYISGRRIACIKLKAPIPSTLGDIFFIELSDQKPDAAKAKNLIISSSTLLPCRTRTWSAISQCSQNHRHPTRDIILSSDFIMRCTLEPLIDKIKREQMEP